MFQKELTCAVAVNLGATKTGVCAFVGSADKPIQRENVCAAIIVTPTDGDGITFSSRSRTDKRHEIRNRTRFGLARRMMNAIVDHLLEVGHQDLHPKKVEAIHDAMASLLRRRGFTYSETDLSVFDQLDCDVFKSHPVLAELANALGSHPFFGSYFGTAKDDENDMDCDRIEEVLQREDFPTKRTFKSFLTAQAESNPDLDVTGYVEALSALVDEAVASSSLRSRGRKSRRVYQKNVTELVLNDRRLRPLLVALNGEASQLANILLHVSNLELRALRRYFEDPRVQCSKWGFDAEALQKVLNLAFKRFAGGVSHIHEKNPSAYLVKVILECKSEDLLNALGKLDPALTIPPFERLTNRRTPIDHTLFLSPERLTAHFPKWTSWAEKIARANPELEEDLDEILSHIDRHSRRADIVNKEGRTASVVQLRLAYVLHRALDRSKALDPYALRRCSDNPQAQANKKALSCLATVIGAQNVDEFLGFARAYYDEVEVARRGLFNADETRFFERSDIHPPRVQKILSFLVADILRSDTHVAEEFIRRVWTMPVICQGRRTVKSACKFIEEARKDDGILFHREYKAALIREYRQLPKEPNDKTYLAVAKLVDAVSVTIAEALNLDDDVRQKFANPYSLAQLYNLIEVNRMGYSSITVAARLENAWRSRMVQTVVNGEEITCANAVRLTSDTVRPFDGVLAKVLDRQAHEVAKVVFAALKETKPDAGSVLNLPIIVEQNKFSFELSLAELKRIKNNRAEKGLERVTKRWMEKDDRIRAANKVSDDSYLCPFTGKKFSQGQFLTIKSPKATRFDGRAYAVEPNLIYCSNEGHRNIEGLESLHPNYLKHVFGTPVVSEIEAQIEEVVDKIIQEDRLTPFHQLSLEEQTIVRHALFLNNASPAHRNVISSIRTQFKTTTNGTQAWFIRRLIEKIKDQFAPWCQRHRVKIRIDANTTDQESTSRIRRTLVGINPELRKDKSAGIMSSVIDAACVGAAGWSFVRHWFDPQSSLRNLKVLNQLLPTSCEVVRVASKKPGELVGNTGKRVDAFMKPVFKSTLYGEDFLPLYTSHGKLYVGYRSMKEGVVEVEGKQPEELLNILLPFTNQTVIKPLSEWVTYTIDKTKAFEHLNYLAQHETDDDIKLLQGELLESLHFFFNRPSLETILLNKTGDKMKAYHELVDEVTTNTSVKLALKSSKRGLFKATGQIALPVRMEWMKLISNEHIASHYGESFNADRLDRVMAKVRPQSAKNSHQPNRWSVSLPMVTSPSGTPVRIKRRNYRGETLYQTQTVSASTAGFAVEKGKVIWKMPVLPEHLKRPAFTVYRDRKVPHSQMIGLEDWRLVIEKPIKVWVCPGTAQRRKIRVEGAFETLKPWINALNPKIQFESGSALPASMAYKASEVNIIELTRTCFGENVAQLFDKPKSRILFSRVGETVVLTFTPNSASKAMNEMFDKGK